MVVELDVKAVLEGPPPSWLRHCTDQALQARLGPDTCARGAAYARDRAVRNVETRGQGMVLHATVRGSRSRSYSTLVRAHAARPGGPVDWTGHCTCPMQVDCKHVAAVLFTARDRLPAPPATITSWESRLADVVRPAASESTVPRWGCSSRSSARTRRGSACARSARAGRVDG